MIQPTLHNGRFGSQIKHGRKLNINENPSNQLSKSACILFHHFTVSMKPYIMSTPKCCSDHSEGDTIYKRESCLGWQIPNGVTSKQQRCPDVAFIDRSIEYHITTV